MEELKEGSMVRLKPRITREEMIRFFTIPTLSEMDWEHHIDSYPFLSHKAPGKLLELFAYTGTARIEVARFYRVSGAYLIEEIRVPQHWLFSLKKTAKEPIKNKLTWKS